MASLESFLDGGEVIDSDSEVTGMERLIWCGARTNLAQPPCKYAIRNFLALAEYRNTPIYPRRQVGKTTDLLYTPHSTCGQG